MALFDEFIETGRSYIHNLPELNQIFISHSQRNHLYKILDKLVEDNLTPNTSKQITLIEKIHLQSKADVVVYWSGILTVRKLLPVWQAAGIVDEYLGYSTDVQQIITMAEDILNNSIDYEEALDEVSERFYMGAAGLHTSTTLNTFCVHASAYNILESLVISTSFLNRYPINQDADFLDYATIAVAAIADHRPGFWAITRDWSSNIWDEVNAVDETKLVAFLEWWLTEAILQAWELAQATFASNL